MVKRTYFIVSLLAALTLKAQDFNDDAALWLSFKLEKKLGNGLSAYVKHQSRFNENMTAYGLSYLDLGASFKINKLIKLYGGAVLSRKDPFYELYQNRQRYYFSINLKHDIKKFELSFRNQTQLQIKQQSGLEYEIYNRNKLGIDYEVNKRISLNLSQEVYLPLNDPEGYFIDRSRTTIGAAYKIRKGHSLEPYFLYQFRMVSSTDRDFIYGINYAINF